MKETPINFNDLINKYVSIQCKVVSLINCLSESACTATPGKFLLAQFKMSQMAQIGESISNLISTASSMIMNTIRNFRQQ